MHTPKKETAERKGFTLIELLVVISIIGLLSAIILNSMANVRFKAKNAALRQNITEVQKAILFYYDKFGVMPPNHVGRGGTPYCCTGDAGCLQEVINQGFISTIAKANYNVCYYDAGSNTPAGGLVWSFVIENEPQSAVGYPGTCRPYPAGTGPLIGGSEHFCSAEMSWDYCICNPY